MVEPDALGDLDHVGAGRFAHVRDLVDERDPRHQERVRRELDHLGGVDVGTHDGALDALVEPGHRLAVLGLERADDDPVGSHEVAHCVSFGEELRVRDVADVRETAQVEAGPHLLPGPHRDRRLHDQDRTTGELRQLVDDGPDTREVGVAGIRGRRVDADEEELAIDDVLHVEREREPLGDSARSSSGTSCSWNGTSPRWSIAIFSGTTSRITTSWPSSAKHAPVTRPTQPAPKIPIFELLPIGAEPTFRLLAVLDPWRSRASSRSRASRARC